MVQYPGAAAGDFSGVLHGSDGNAASGGTSTASPAVQGEKLSFVVPEGVSPQDLQISAGELDLEPLASVVRGANGFAAVASFGQDRPDQAHHWPSSPGKTRRDHD